MGKLNVELQIRLKEQLEELVETYGLEGIMETLEQIKLNTPEEKPEQAAPPQASMTVDKKMNYAQEAEVKPVKSNLPPNIKSVEEFESTIQQFGAKGLIQGEVLTGINGFIQNAKQIMTGNAKQLDEAFIFSLTSQADAIKAMTPEEDWIKYNAEIIRKLLKRKLRFEGYDFLDSEVEVGKTFDPERHNNVGTEPVDNPAMDKRVLKVMNEGLIIDRKLHINANVVVGAYKAN